MDLPSALLLLAAGLSAGFIDAVAGGGGLITVPALLWAGLPVQTALGTNKMQSSCGTVIAVWSYARAGLIRWREFRLGLAVAVAFAFAMLGAHAVTLVGNELLKRIVPWMLLAIAVYAAISPRLGFHQSPRRMSFAVFGGLLGAVLGFYDGFFGPGTGSFWTVACLTLLGLSLPQATGYTKMVNLASNVASLIIFILAAKVRFDVAAVMIAGQLIGARLGSGLAIRHGAPFIRVIFLAVVFAMTAKLLWDQFGR